MLDASVRGTEMLSDNVPPDCGGVLAVKRALSALPASRDSNHHCLDLRVWRYRG